MLVTVYTGCKVFGLLKDDALSLMEERVRKKRRKEEESGGDR